MSKQQSLAALPNPQTVWAQWKKVPLLAMTYQAKLDGGTGQSNPTSPPPPPSPSCSYGFASGPTYIPPSWTGWDASGWTQGSWSYSCNPPPPPPPPVFSGGYGGGGPVLCQGAYCLQPDGSVTGPVGPYGTSATVAGLVGVVDASGNIVIRQYNTNNPSAPPTTLQTITGTNAVVQSGYGIVAQSAATGINGTGGTAVAGNQITTNATNLTTGQVTMQLGGGYSYTRTGSNGQGVLCTPSGDCVSAQTQNNQLNAILPNGNVVQSNFGVGNGGSSATTSVLNTTVTNPLTQQTQNVTGKTATPTSGAGGQNSGG